MVPQDVSNYNQLIRLARLPRLYRMTKLIRLVKLLKSFSQSKNGTIQKISKALKSMTMNQAIVRMIQGMITAVLLTHIFACFWYLTAKFADFAEGTWV